MERDYVVHLHWADGVWTGQLQTEGRMCCFSGIPALLEHLEVDPFTRLTQLERMAHMDPLTELFNRRGVAREVDRMLAAGVGRMALLVIDVDDLKAINDNWGHRKGDEVLRTVAQILRRVGGPEAVAGRLGGDEFVLVLREVPDEQSLVDMGEEICRQAARAEGAVRFSVSVGACGQGGSYQELIEGADLALYRVKRSGKGSVFLERTR